MESHVHVYAPPPGHPLEPYVLSIFRVRADTPYRETILPKGNVDLLFNLGGTVHGEGMLSGPGVIQEGAAWIGGLKTRPYVVHPRGPLHLMGVCLRADGCSGLLPLAPGEIINLDARDLPPAAGIGELPGRLNDAGSFADQCALLVRWLTARLRPRRGADVARHACALLRRTRGDDAVRTTAKALAVSPRHLRRMVTEHVGIGPAEYVRLARFTASLHRMAVPGGTLTQVAYDAGYYDQAHFCRDFRSFAGMTPQEYRARANGPVVGHIVAE
jgi:AraC-like DNA-binding protein